MINKTCPLILRGLYFYDFKSAFPRILGSVNFDLEDVDMSNKEERNKAIGIAQRDNQNLSGFLNSSVANLLEMYLKENNIKIMEIDNKFAKEAKAYIYKNIED